VELEDQSVALSEVEAEAVLVLELDHPSLEHQAQWLVVLALQHDATSLPIREH